MNHRSSEKLNRIILDTKDNINSLPISVVLGRIFAVETILKVKNEALLKFNCNPHPGQIVAILLLLNPKTKVQGT